MRLYALVLALVACRVSALPLGPESTQDVQPAQIELIEDSDVEKLRNVPDVIPVAIVEDTIPQEKIDENSNDYIPSDEKPNPIIKRLEVDLTNPGPPQRQEHETQNPASFSDRDSFVVDIKQKLLEAENVFRKSVSNVNEGFENWVQNSGHLKMIQNNIKDMQSKFLPQLDNLHRSLQSYLNPQSAKAAIIDPETTANLKEVENRLKVLEDNFKVGVQTLSEGVKALEAKADGDAGAAEKPTGTDTASPAPANPTNEQSSNPLSQVFQFFSNTVGQAITQMQNTFNSLTNPSSQTNADGSNTATQPSWNPLPGIFNSQSSSAPPSGVQSDETTARPPSLWDSFQIQLAQFFESNPLNQAFQNIINQVRPSTELTPSANTNKKPENDQVAQNTAPVPVKPIQSQTPAQSVASVEPQVEPVQAPQPSKDSQAKPQPSPLGEIVQNNPIVKGIVQRIQSISNPEKPRGEELEKESELATPEKASEPAKPEDSIIEESVPATKGHGGHNGNNGNSGDSNDTDGINVKSAPTDEKIEEVPHKCEMEKKKEVASDKEEKETALLPDKTE